MLKKRNKKKLNINWRWFINGILAGAFTIALAYSIEVIDLMFFTKTKTAITYKVIQLFQARIVFPVLFFGLWMGHLYLSQRYEIVGKK